MSSARLAGTEIPQLWKARLKGTCQMLIKQMLNKCFSCPILWENNALELVNQSTRYTGYKHKPYNKCVYMIFLLQGTVRGENFFALNVL